LPACVSTRESSAPCQGTHNNASERDLRPAATYRKVTGGFRSNWGADLFAVVRSVVGTATRGGIDAYQAIRDPPSGQSVLAPG
jgi:transposase